MRFTNDELRMLSNLVSEAREGWDEDATDEELALACSVTKKIRQALRTARRKAEAAA